MVDLKIRATDPRVSGRDSYCRSRRISPGDSTWCHSTRSRERSRSFGYDLDLPGSIALLGSSLAYALGNVYNRRNVRGLPLLVPAVFQVTFALIIVGTLALVLEQPWTARPDVGDWFSVVWLGVFGSGLAYILYFRLLGRWGATRTSLVAYLLPVYGIVLGFLVLREPVDVTLILGTTLVIAGVALVNSPWGQRRLFRVSTPAETA